MGSQNSISLSLSLIACFFISSSLAYTNFYVGGKDGWVLHPSEPYRHWAERLRFLINDTLVFNYKKGSDSVLQVSKDGYYNCRKQKPLKSMTSGSSVFQFDRPGPFFFISGHQDNCEKGQKLIVVVLHSRPATPQLTQISPSAPISNPPKSSSPPSTSPFSSPPASEISTASPSPISPPPSTSTPPLSSPPPYAPSSPPTSSTPPHYAPSSPPAGSAGRAPLEKTPAPTLEEDNKNAPAPSASTVVSSCSMMAFVVTLLVGGVFFG